MPEPTEQQRTDAPETVTVEVAGAKFTGTKDEVIEKMARSVEHGSTTIKELRDAAERLNHTLEEINKPKPLPDGSFDKTKYFNLLAEDPINANEYLDQFRYGEDPKQYRQKMAAALQTASLVEQTMHINRFISNLGDEWSGDPADAEMLLKKLDSDGKSVTYANLLEGYQDLRVAGKFQGKTKKEESGESKEARRPPPSSRGTGDLRYTGNKRAEDMTPEEIKKEIERIQKGAKE